MQVQVYLERENEKKTVELKAETTAQMLLDKLQINSETVLVIRNKTVILPETFLKEGDSIKLLSVISGG